MKFYLQKAPGCPGTAWGAEFSEAEQGARSGSGIPGCASLRCSLSPAVPMRTATWRWSRKVGYRHLHPARAQGGNRGVEICEEFL